MPTGDRVVVQVMLGLIAPSRSLVAFCDVVFSVANEIADQGFENSCEKLPERERCGALGFISGDARRCGNLIHAMLLIQNVIVS
jgi:hypothetical protein